MLSAPAGRRDTTRSESSRLQLFQTYNLLFLFKFIPFYVVLVLALHDCTLVYAALVQIRLVLYFLAMFKDFPCFLAVLVVFKIPFVYHIMSIICRPNNGLVYIAIVGNHPPKLPECPENVFALVQV